MKVTQTAIQKEGKRTIYDKKETYYLIQAEIMHEEDAQNVDFVIIEDHLWGGRDITRDWLKTSKKALQNKHGVKCFLK